MNIWSILIHRKSLWVQWVHSYRLKGRSFWEVPLRGSVSWGWRKLLQLRDTVRPFIRIKLGSGLLTSAWFDSWCNVGPLSSVVSHRDIKRASLSIDDKVADIIVEEEWKWPVAWYDLFPILITIQRPILVPDQNDLLIWRDANGKESRYSSSCVWDSIRSRQPEVPWTNIVWFSNCIPRHAFLLWLVLKRKLKTQDRLKPWDVGGVVNLNLLCCSLCKQGPDSHDHLYFDCPFSYQVWMSIRSDAYMQHVDASLEAITTWLIGISSRSSISSVVGRLVFAASTYFIWQERNNRIYSNQTRTPDQVCNVIFSTVRMKLLGMKLKVTLDAKCLIQVWKMHALLIKENEFG